jgi:uncharacterized membrane protein YbjE (DUF340 family)
MGNAQDILVIILSTFLAIFLLLNIVALIFIVKIVKTVQRITDKAEQLADKAEEIGDFVKHATGPIIIGRALSVISSTFFGRKSKSKRKGE